MTLLNLADLRELIEIEGKWRISLYMPTHPIGREQQQNPVRFKNLLTRAKKKLLEYDLRRPEVESLVRSAEELLLDADFWVHQNRGLAAFLSEGFSRFYRLPIDFPELLLVANSFHLKPLLPLLNTDGQFYILAINLNGIRLYLATRDTINEVELSGIPTRIDEALWMDESERHVNFHVTGSSTGRGRGGGRQAIFHGQAMEEDEKKNILRFFHYFDQRLNALLKDKNILIIPAAVEYLLPLYREANTYDHLLEQALIGAPEKLSIQELHQRTWQIIEPIFKERQRLAVEEFNELHGQQNGLTTTDLETAVKAAEFGQVATLFVPLGVQKWGRYDPANNKVLPEPEPSRENEDLLDFAAAHTILNSGQVFAVQPEEIPGDGDVAAILRYAIPENP